MLLAAHWPWTLASILGNVSLNTSHPSPMGPPVSSILPSHAHQEAELTFQRRESIIIRETTGLPYLHAPVLSWFPACGLRTENVDMQHDVCTPYPDGCWECRTRNKGRWMSDESRGHRILSSELTDP